MHAYSVWERVHCDPVDGSLFDMAEEEEYFWSFGFGSNMDVEFVEKTKGVQVLDHAPAILPDYRLAYSYKGLACVEPAWANIVEEDGQEVHGVAFCMTKEAMVKIKGHERGYRTQMVTLTTYDGRKVNGFIFIRDQKDVLHPEHLPSKRYMDILISGARRAGLKESYVKKLENEPTYSPPKWLLKVRAERPKLSELPPITTDELADHKHPDGFWVSILGYVIKPAAKDPSYLDVMHGRDITTSIYLHTLKLAFYGDDEDSGLPPYPLTKDIPADNLEYITQFLDYYHAGQSHDGVTDMGQIVGHLVEFRMQQESGKTTWTLPK